MASKIAAEKPRTDDEKLRSLIPRRVTSNIKKNDKEKGQSTRTVVPGKHFESITDIKGSNKTGMLSKSKKWKSLPEKSSILMINNEAKTCKDVLEGKKKSSTVGQKFANHAGFSVTENERKKFADKKINCTKQTNIVNMEELPADNLPPSPRRDTRYGGMNFIPTKKRKTLMFDFHKKLKEPQNASYDDYKDENV